MDLNMYKFILVLIACRRYEQFRDYLIVGSSAKQYCFTNTVYDLL